MPVSYRKLRKIMKTNDIYMYQLQIQSGLANGTLSKVGKEDYMQLDKLDIICESLENMLRHKIGDIKLDFSDIIERVTSIEKEQTKSEYKLR